MLISNRVQPNMREYRPELDTWLVGSGEQLKNGIWPRSIPLWMAAFYIALFILRPWELLTWLAAIHFERLYGICMILVLLFSRKKQFIFTFQSVAVLLFLGGISMSALFAQNPSLSWVGVYDYATLVIFFFILFMVILNSYELTFMVTCYIVTMAVYLAKSQWEFFVNGQHTYDMGVYRLTGIESTFGGPNELAMSIVASLPFVILLWNYRKEFSFAWPDFWRKIFPLFILFYFALAIFSLVMTHSRSGIVGLVLFVALAVFQERGFSKKMKYALVAAAFLAILWQVMPPQYQGRIRTMWAPETGPRNAQISAEGRIEGYKAGIIMFERFPLTGVGINNFIEYRVAHVDGVALNAHNLAGQVLGETGLIGGITFLLLVITILVNCRKVKILPKNSSDQTFDVLSNLAVAFRTSLILLAFEGMFGHNMLRFNWLWLAAFSALVLHFARQHQQEKNQKNSQFHKLRGF